ncbi:MAG: signal recognition particle protein, partial [Clostridia bacterium]|nr:signal recognition particle protein [Clostridia bacterium]
MFQSLTEKLSAAFSRFRNKGKLTAADVKEGMREIKLALLEADVNYKVVKEFVAAVSERAVGEQVLESLLPAQQIVKIVNEELIRLMGSENAKLEIASKPPTVVMMVGLQGAGKTTHCGKIAALYKKKGKNPLLVACDVYRPAAIEQLKVVGASLNIPVFEMGGKENPVKIAKKGVEYAIKQGHDMVFIDTAGRLHIDEALMKELENIKAEVSPTEILLTVDAMLGQDAVNVAKSFHELLSITGVVLT